MSRFRRENGSLSAEFIAMVPILVVVLAASWQILIFAAAANATTTAARNGSRALSTEGSWTAAQSVIEQTLPGWLDGPPPTLSGTRVTVAVDVPVLLPALGSFGLERSAELPDTPSGR